jgi:hypothetical protein
MCAWLTAGTSTAEVWLATMPLTADDCKGWLVSPRIMQLMQALRALTQVRGNFTCSAAQNKQTTSSLPDLCYRCSCCMSLQCT